MQRSILKLLVLLVLGASLSAQNEKTPLPLKSGLVPPAGAVAVIDGKMISRKDFVDALYDRFRNHITGKQTLETLMSQRILDVQMKERSLVVDEAMASAEFDSIDAQLKKQTNNETDLATEMAKKGMSKARMLSLLRYKIALEKLAAKDFAKDQVSAAEQEQWLKAKRREAKPELDPAKLPADAAAKVYEDFVTREDFAGNLIQYIETEESVKLVEALMQAKLAENLCAAEELTIDKNDVAEVYAEKKASFESDPKYQGIAFANFVEERYGMDAETHKNSANFRREVCLTRLGEKMVSESEAIALYKEQERNFGPIYQLRHIIIRGSDDAKFAGQMRKLDEAKKVADDVWKRLDTGTTQFEEAASLFSEDARSKFKKGEWDSFTPAQLDQIDGGATILGLAVGGFTKPLLFAGGYRIVKLEEKLPVPPMSPQVAVELRRNRAFDLFAQAWKDARRGYDLERLLPSGAPK